MEVYAAIISLKDLPSKVSVQLNSDSEYLVKTMNGEFKRKKNIEYWDALDAALEGKTVCWEWVRGHAGNEYNERCDKLAVQASQRPDLPYEAIPSRIDEVHIERKVLRKEAKSQPLNRKPQKCYAVVKGRNKGIFFSWEECKEQIEGYKGAEYKRFESYQEAVKWLNENTGSKSKSTGKKKQHTKSECKYFDVGNCIKYHCRCYDCREYQRNPTYLE